MRIRHWAYEPECPSCHDLAAETPWPVACDFHVEYLRHLADQYEEVCRQIQELDPTEGCQ